MRCFFAPRRTRASEHDGGRNANTQRKQIERRIAELTAKGEQNLDLIKAMIETTRKKQEGELSQERLDWN